MKTTPLGWVWVAVAGMSVAVFVTWLGELDLVMQGVVAGIPLAMFLGISQHKEDARDQDVYTYVIVVCQIASLLMAVIMRYLTVTMDQHWAVASGTSLAVCCASIALILYAVPP
jgi:hypothetical protein